MPIVVLIPGGNKSVSGGGATKTNVGGNGTIDAASGIVVTGNIGTATTTRIILIAANRQNGPFTGVDVNGVAATRIVGGATANNQADFWSLIGAAAGSGSQTITCAGGAFEARSMEVWIMDGLSSTSPQQSGLANGTTIILSGVTAGDFIFSTAYNGSALNWNTSTQAPDNSYNPNTSGNIGWDADWVAASTASFNVVASVSGSMAALNFR